MVARVSRTVRFATALAVGGLVVVAARTPAAGQAATGAPAKVCGLLPIADIEALYGTKADAPRGTDNTALSTCSVTIANQIVTIRSSAPGTSGAPVSVQAGLAAQQAQPPGRGMTRAEARDYGDVGCLHSTMTEGPDRKPLPKPIHATSCFLVTGGYLHLTLTSDDAGLASDEHVKGLLAKAAARRK
ncbi:MAG TPA: hypothetical protein VLT86_19620 [Vicinamibacterales bacterium]|nr:hypothetical protein [Vicinamibacterales bacterium]